MIEDVSVLIFDKNRRILFSKRSKNKKLFPSHWTMSAEGHSNTGESLEDTAHRELKEELGFDTNLTFLEKIVVNEPPDKYLTSLYIGQYQGEKIAIEPLEIEEVRFLSKTELQNLLKAEKTTEFTKKFANGFWDGKYDHSL